jgi:STE24 endopeptidase
METLVVLWILVALGGALLERAQLRHLRAHGHEVPPELASHIDAGALQRIMAYTQERGRLRLVRMLVLQAATGLFLFAGGLAFYDGAVTALVRHFMGALPAEGGHSPGPQPQRFILQGVLFLAGIVVLETLVEIPFSLYATFRIETRHGFNRTTRRLWAADLMKGLGLSILVGSLLAGFALWLVGRSPDHWWLWVWGFLVGAGIVLMLIAPSMIEPLFSKFRPLEIPALEERIRDLLRRAGVRAGRILQVDASRRSRHSNAYFTGIGPVKRVVLFDTLLARSTHDEIVAVLAHELAHWKLRHVYWRLLRFAAGMLAGLYIGFRALRWEGLPELAGLTIASFPARVMILAFITSLVAWLLAPLGSALARRDEWAADRFAVRLTGEPAHLASALATLARENLANLHPLPLYARVFDSHPPIVERLRALRREPPAARRPLEQER